MYQLNNIFKSFDGLEILKDIHLHIEKQEIISLIGPSGCGKTTLMNIIAGLDKCYEGEVKGLTSESISYLFQDLRLLPWKNVYDNMKFVLKSKISQDKLHETIMEYLHKVELDGYENYAIHELSGGMQQRLSLARAFAYPSELLLMDEPFKSLDFEIRHQIIEGFKSLWMNKKKTVIFVTHDIQSAILLSDRILLLSKKPTSIVKEYRNEMSIMERDLKDTRFPRLEREIYLDFMKLV